MVHKLIDYLDNFHNTSTYRKRNYIQGMKKKSNDGEPLTKTNLKLKVISDLKNKIYSKYLLSGLDVIEKWKNYNCLNISSTLEQNYEYDDPNYLDNYIHISQSNKHSQPFKNLQHEKNAKLDSTETTIKDNIKKTSICINTKVSSIQDLLDIIEKNPLSKHYTYNIDMKKLHNIKEPLIQLNNMIGMEQFKENIIEQLLYFIQNLHLVNSKHNLDFMHTVFYGPPGTGKTEVAKILGTIFSKLGLLKNGTFKKTTRSDFIAGYLGQTALKTRELLESCYGGVLFIDEAYALGNSEKQDSYAKECLDTLCEILSDHKDELMVIIAGYENELQECFFSYNSGLESRFTWRFTIDKYSAKELLEIFKKKIVEADWTLNVSNEVLEEWFKKNIDIFKYFGRDIESLFLKCKVAHSKRVFCLDEKEKTILTIDDIDMGLERFIKMANRSSKPDIYNFLYV